MKKLTPSKMLSSMALATLLVAAAGTTSAQAALSADFPYDAGNNTQVGGSTDAKGGSLKPATGEIEIDGNFEKSVTTLPTPKDDGKYLIVAMPISMGYTYNADTKALVGSHGVIENHSVEVSSQMATPKSMKMRLLGLKEGTRTTDAEVQFITTPDAGATGKIQVPLQLSLTASGMQTPKVHNFKDIVVTNPSNSHVVSEIEVPAGTTVSVDIDPIANQQVENDHLIQKPSSIAKHTLHFQFEYAGN